ncbi:glycosyltransferase [Mycobacteroides sp. LB1]|uniref:glycosyltransferase n=1 Tax=Mycobacteroides sp. LB1 TaxID=2750814 RepID=UPI0021031A96
MDDSVSAPGDFDRAPTERAPSVGVVALVDAVFETLPPGVVHQWVRSARNGAAAAAVVLNRHDVAIIQHEYGIFGGRDGADVLETVRALRVPTISVFHTVLVTPTAHQRTILEKLADATTAIVTMTSTARQRLIDHYAVDPAKIRVIPHGAANIRSQPEYQHQPITRTPVILTWGLLGDGKGIEWAIDAMALIANLRPAPQYQVVGQTHPRVLERHGESYRNRLIERAHRRGVANTVHFDARYLDHVELRRLIRQADVVLLPYDSREQVTSGVLIEAVAAGKPVVSTAFPHAQELLSTGAGLLVDRQDPAAIASALRRVLTEPQLAARMSAEANRIAPELFWPAVGRKYRELATEIHDADSVMVSA